MLAQSRRPCVWSLLLLMLAACGPTAEPSAVKNTFGPDNRETAPDAAPYKAVGRIDSGCTGTLIGKRLVLTAAHCVIDNATGTVKPQFLYFRPNFRGGTSREKVWMDYAWLGTAKPEDERIKDWAIVRLERAVGDTYGTVGVHEVPFSTSLPYTTSLTGYSTDRNEGKDPSLHRGCYVMEIVDGKLYHECDGAAGVSGGPMINLINGNNYITAITVSEFRQGAPDSVHRDAYSRAYANVALSSEGFAQTVRQLIQTIDSGIPAPRIPGVVERTNPNQRPADPDDPNDPNDPNGPYSAARVVSVASLQSQTQTIRRTMTDLGDAAEGLDDFARRVGAQGLPASTNSLVQAVSDLGGTLRQICTSTQPVTPGYRTLVFERYRIVKRLNLDLEGYTGLRSSPSLNQQFQVQIRIVSALVQDLEGEVFQ